MQLATVSDTHIPERETEIPESFRDRIAGADHVVHAGDFETTDALADVRELAPALTAVHGNADPKDIGLPAVDSVTLGGVTFVVTHGTRNLAEAGIYQAGTSVMSETDWLNAIADAARIRTRAWTSDDPVVGIGGHSHQVVDEVHEGLRVLNPGSATGAVPAEDATMMTVDVDGDEESGADVDVTLHEV